mgnify:CR=1 FL=1
MEIAKSFTVTVPHAKHNLLIATQGSAYKNAVVEGVIEATKGRQMTIEVIDVSALSKVKIEDWNAIVVIHTWENWQPQMEAAKFAQQHHNLTKVIFLATSGKGDLSIPGVDAITSASLLADVPTFNVADVPRPKVVRCAEASASSNSALPAAVKSYVAAVPEPVN